jgi:hypothetical protein
MVRVAVADPSWLEAALPLFDGFPYLTVRVVHVLRHITLLPRDWTPEDLDMLARRQTAANRLESCLVLSSRLAIYYGADGGSGSASPTPPYGGLLVTGRLQPPVAFPATGKLEERAGRLSAHIKRTQSEERYILGDPTKGGRPATADEVVRLEGRQPDGVLRGLTRCFVCQSWAGASLDPHPRFHGQVMRVHCRCDNDNRCARCGKQLTEWKLNANYYDEGDGQVWHVPGFCGLSHRCVSLQNEGEDHVAPGA